MNKRNQEFISGEGEGQKGGKGGTQEMGPHGGNFLETKIQISMVKGWTTAFSIGWLILTKEGIV